MINVELVSIGVKCLPRDKIYVKRCKICVKRRKFISKGVKIVSIGVKFMSKVENLYQ